ncbi:MAG: ABC transporter permease [Candidatus Rokubacteria bacterium]|nr:ABC transporter permease [Candidatus Rokubacteria bacterium]
MARVVDTAAVPTRAPDRRRSLSPARLAWRVFLKNRSAVAGMAIVLAFFGVALAGLALTKGEAPLLDPREVRLPDRLKPPFSTPNRAVVPAASLPRLGVYLFGTDELGRDIFARMLEGGFVALSVGFVAVGIAVGLGLVLGGVAGYYGRSRVGIGRLRLLSVDALITGLIDVMLSFPSFFLILTVVAVLKPSIWNIMVVIGLTSWEGTARFVRAEILSLREQEFIQAAQAVGLPGRRVIFRHLLPNAVAPVLVSATLGIAGAILTESGLSFLGFGVPPPDATWGNILSDGKRYIFDAAWLTVIPGTAIFVVVLAFNLFGQGLREALNPKLREG